MNSQAARNLVKPMENQRFCEIAIAKKLPHAEMFKNPYENRPGNETRNLGNSQAARNLVKPMENQRFCEIAIAQKSPRAKMFKKPYETKLKMQPGNRVDFQAA